MAPQPGVTFPERRFIVTRLDEGTGVTNYADLYLEMEATVP